MTEVRDQDLNESKRKLVVKSAVRVVKLEQIQTDSSYQRAIKRGHRGIIADLNEVALGIPLVGEREDGSLWIVDGLQRITALRARGWSTVRAEVFRSDGPEHEAAVFKIVNMKRTPLTAIEKYRALLTAGDEIAWKLKEAVEALEFRMGVYSGSVTEESKANCLGGVGTLMNIVTQSGTAPITFALICAREAWPGDKLGVHHNMIEGMTVFWRRQEGVVDQERFVERLRTVTPQKILYAASQATIAGNKGAAVGEQLEKVYRKRLHRRA